MNPAPITIEIRSTGIDVQVEPVVGATLPPEAIAQLAHDLRGVVALVCGNYGLQVRA